MNTLRHPSLCTRSGMVHPIRKLLLLPILISFFAVTSSFNESGMPSSGLLPKIVSTTPAPNATHVDVVSLITATFSEPINESTLNNSTIIVTGGGTVSGNISYSDNKVTFKPSSDLRKNTTYKVTITTGVEDLAGNALENEVIWTFETDEDDDDDD